VHDCPPRIPPYFCVETERPYAGFFGPAQTSTLLKHFLKFILIKLPVETLTKMEHYKKTLLGRTHRLIKRWNKFAEKFQKRLPPLLWQYPHMIKHTSCLKKSMIQLWDLPYLVFYDYIFIYVYKSNLALTSHM